MTDVNYTPDFDPVDVDGDYGSTGGDITVPTFHDIKPFRFWCQKALPLVYDDSLSYYEVLCKVVSYLNNMMTDLTTGTGAITQFANQFVINQQFLNDMAEKLGENTEELEDYINDRMGDFTDAYNELQDYVNEYFNNLDVQDEIDAKLDDMAESGQFNVLFDPVIQAWMEDETEYINTSIATQNSTLAQQNGRISVLESRMDEFDALPSGSTAGNAELVGIRTNFLGEVYPSAGDAVRASDLIASGYESIPYTRLTDWDGNESSVQYDTIQFDVSNFKGGKVAFIANMSGVESTIENAGSIHIYKSNVAGKTVDSDAVDNGIPADIIGQTSPNYIFKTYAELPTDITGEERCLLQLSIPADFAYQYVKVGHVAKEPGVGETATLPYVIVYATSWSRTQVDDTLSVSGEAADAKATGDALSELNERWDDYTHSAIIPFTSGYITTGGVSTVDLNTVTQYQNYKHAVVDCEEGDIFTVIGSAGGTPRLWCFIDSSNNVLYVADGGASETYKEITAPANSAKLVININGTGEAFIGYTPDRLYDKAIQLISTPQYSNYLSENADLNTITSHGNYVSTTQAISATLANSPVTNRGFKMVVIATNANSRIYQIIIANQTPDAMFYRFGTLGSTWAFTAWKKIATSEDISTVEMESNSIIGKNLLLNSTPVSRTHNGVTFTRNSDGSYTVSGTSVNDYAFIELYYSLSVIPSWLKYDTQYYIQYSSTQVNLIVSAIDTQGSPSSLYNGNWSGSFYIPSEYVGLIIRLRVPVGRTVNETVYPIITDTIPYKFLSDKMSQLGNGIYGYGRRITTLSNVRQSNPKDVSPGSLIKITGLSDSSNILVCGKNLYRNPHELSTYTTNNVTYTYNESDGTITVESEGATGTTVYPNYITTLNGIGWAGLFKFSLKTDAIVTFSDNASVERFVYNKLCMQVGDGTNLTALLGHNLTMKCLANVEYGVRLYVKEGFSGTVVFKPQIEINGYATEFEPFSGIYDDGNGNKIVINNQNSSADAVMIPGNVATVISYDNNVSVTYLKQDRIDVSYNSAIKVKPKIAKKPLMLSFLDDDTLNLTYVELFHDTLVELGAIGNYATITNHLLSSNALQNKLLEYETEGFGIVCHCSNQDGSATDYFRPYEDRDIDEARQNMITAVRYIKEAGFISGDIWATPYGVNDSQIQELAKSLGFRGLISGMNYTPVFGNITSKYNIPRYSIDVSNDITKAGMDACVENGGWIIVTSHTYNWGDDVQAYKQKIGELIAYANSIGMKIVNIEEGFRTFFDS